MNAGTQTVRRAPARTAPPLRASDPVGAAGGIDEKHARGLASLGIHTIEDLLRLAPRRVDDRREIVPLASLKDHVGSEVTVAGRLAHLRSVPFGKPGGRRLMIEWTLEDDSGRGFARWYDQRFRLRQRIGLHFLLYAEVRAGKTGLHLFLPEAETVRSTIRLERDHPGWGRLVPVHPIAKGVGVPWLRSLLWRVLARLEPVPETMPPSCLRGEPMPSLDAAVRVVHFPATVAEGEAARRRLAYDELFVHEVLLARRRREREATRTMALRWTETLDRRIRTRFPFAPTPGQEKAIAEIRSDLARPVPMNRLLQGDVGAGKTAVAAYACLVCVANRRQAAFMAPTEVLARQHQATLEALLQGSRVRLATLYGAQKAKERREALARIASGEADLVVGTHAVISRGVQFASLGLVVVDEQHKFGVRQRRELLTKGEAPHCLVMTATPIPRTLAMVVYGDLDVSVLSGRPPGRGATETFVVPASGVASAEMRLRDELAKGRQAFVVYPLVRPSDRAGLKAATQGREDWAKACPGRRVGLVHGQMPAEERQRTMDAFRQRRLDVLVATVVIEVGIDVPNATMLVVEHAERFGLSQLHQLRGRIGRGPGGGVCVLVDRGEGGTPDRLRVLAETEDGFRVAEEDLRLRGAGDLFGTRQAGAPFFAAARFPDDLDVLVRAREAVRGLLDRDPLLAAAELGAVRERIAAREAAAGDVASGG